MTVVRAFISIFLVLGGVAAKAAEPSGRNILIFLCDDVGWGEFGFQGNSQIPTPNIDSIAAGGIRFTQGYVSGPYCSPTRAGLMTGRYQTRFGHEFNSSASRTLGLSLKEKTIADHFKGLGYATAAVGKWHLGAGLDHRPTARGFDEFYGTLGNTPYFKPNQFVDSRKGNEVAPPSEPDFYTTDAYAARAVEFIEKNKSKSWMLYVPFNAQHAPLEAPKKYLDRFAKIEDEQRRTFAAMMSAMDDAVGRILAKVREIRQEENTLVFFLADNGGPTRSTTSQNGPLRGSKATTWEGGVRVPFAMQWKGKLPAGKAYEHPIIQLDIFATALAAAGQEIKDEWKLDGVNLLPYLTGAKSERPHPTLYWRFGEQWAIRHGDFKLVKGNGESAPLLIDLSKDVSESTDLSAANPEKVKELIALYETWSVQQAAPIAPKEKPAARRKKAK